MIKIEWHHLLGDYVWFGWYRTLDGKWCYQWHNDSWVIKKYGIPWYRIFKRKHFGKTIKFNG